MSQFNHGYALLIGVNDHVVQRYRLPDVIKDIDALKNVLLSPERCGYLQENVRILSGKQATKANIESGLDWLAQKIQADPNATALIYFSGHGAKKEDSELFLLPYDGDRREMLIKNTDFAHKIESMHPKRLLLILDACHSGGTTAKDVSLDNFTGQGQSPDAKDFVSTGATPFSGSKGLNNLSALAEGSGRAVLTSSQGTEQSYIRTDRTMSIFTYHLIEALTGHAQPQEGATEVLISDIMGHVHRNVKDSAQAQHQKPQNPDSRVNGNFPIALLMGGKPWSGSKSIAPEPVADAQHLVNINTGGGDYIEGDKKETNTGGGTVVEGPVTTGGGAFFGGVINNQGGEFVAGNKIINNAGTNAQDLATLFKAIYGQIQARPEDPDVDKEEIVEMVNDIKEEASKEAPKESKLKRWLGNLEEIAPDITEAVIQALTNPAAGVAKVVGAAIQAFRS